MFGLGGTEFLLIAALALLLFGPDKLPEIARTVGRFMREFKRYQAMMESVIRAEVYAAESAAKQDASKEDPFKAAREYREKAGVTPPGQEAPSGDEQRPEEAAEEDEEYDPELAAPELEGLRWTPGAPDAPGTDTDGSGEEAGADG